MPLTFKTIALLTVATAILVACSDTELNQSTTDKTPPVAKTDATATEVATVPRTETRQLLWGDTHLHTTNSADAFAFGARLTPEDALRFARGQQVISTTGIPAVLDRPLDFLMIADHGEGLGISRQIMEGNPALMTDPTVARWSGMMQEGGDASAQAAMELISRFAAGKMPEVLRDRAVVGPIFRSVWEAHNKTVDSYNEPGAFTAFIGYEYTALDIGDNLHRVVMFRDGADKANQVLPFPATVSINPEDLWNALSAYETKTGGQILAIPHNSNLSNGQMFAFSDIEGNPIDADYAAKSARWEPVVEVTQIKGDSESHPFLSPNDEFASYGDAGWELGNLDMSGRKTPDMFAGEYVREALKRGLELENKTGINPFKYGLIGSTNSHTALATGDESNFFGKHSDGEPSAERASKGDGLSEVSRMGWHYLAGGYAAVWAKSNTREDIFDAIMAKEVYATTGPRIALRMFGSWEFSDTDAQASNFVDIGYEKGVPMGGDLSNPQDKNKAPTFLINALKDPIGANLDRVQVIKGWRDKDGALQEKIYDVAWSDDRTFDASGKLPAVGNSVDLSSPSFENSIGDAELRTVWTDPDFDPDVPAFYYTRAIEIPTPRWNAYDAVRYGAKMPEGAVMVTQERAYSSPIWYHPK
ncbi:DUF3604 domain-containing protein [Fretibacter rubidus]|uniref:DUF3604 domain-containing protein n=1 Tax=Fretibacter rubidus TaxID=570162 RepID=UPI003529E626